MHEKLLTVFLIANLFSISVLQARKLSTCGDLEREINTQSDEIVNLKLQLEKYKIADDSSEDVPDECNAFTSCSKCVREKTKSGCGWCFMSNKCSLKENCHDSDSSSQFWIPDGVEKCPKIRAVKPHQLASERSRMLDVIIPYMPEYNKSLICSFEMLGRALFTKGSRTDKGVSCPSPRTDKILPIPEDSNHVTVTLSVQVPNGPSFASTTNFTIFDCRRYTSCSECTSSPFPCAWCSDGNRCTHDVEENCRNDIIIFSKAVPIPSSRQGPNYCTRILPNPSGSSNEILIPSGKKKRILVKEENILHHQVTARFTCKAEDHPRVTGQLLGDIIYCDEIKFKVLYQDKISNLTFDVYWGSDIKMDNPQTLHVVVYHCSRMASNCAECLNLPSQYNCGWCDETNSCTIRDDCAESGWMDRKQKCTKPEIISFYPKAGLFTRPTNITIKGINFGKEFKDIDGGVSLINEDSEIISECKPYEDLFVKFSQIVCLLDVPGLLPEDKQGRLQGFFEVKVQNEYVALAGEEYSFVDPSITGIEPVKGSKSGGTCLTIQGNDLNAGSKVEAFVGDIPCKIVRHDSTNIQCITAPSPRTRSSEVRVIFDGEERTSSTYFFYVEDPYIRSIKTGYYADGPIGTPSGGSLISVGGEYFDHVQNSYMYIILENQKYLGACTVESPTKMQCVSPRVPNELLNFCLEEGSLALDYGFRMGDVEDVQNISMNGRFSKFHMHPDPTFLPFPHENRTKVKYDYLVIEGLNVDSVYDSTDIFVEIGVEDCILTSLSRTQLTCKPPPTRPESKDGDPNKLPEVVVKVRGGQEHFVGFLKYRGQ